MGKALVLQNCDFSANKIKTITFVEVHCTGITLPASASVKAGMETTIEPTLVPANTTDKVTWSSSDPSVATVTSGVVKGIKEGTATVTATCNGHSTTCNVTVQSAKLFAKGGAPCVISSSSGLIDMCGGVKNTSSLFYVSFGASVGELPVYGLNTDLELDYRKDIYPFKIPAGTTQIRFTGTDIAPIIVYFNSKEKSTYIDTRSEKVRDAAKVLYGETPVSGTDYSIDTWVYGERTFTIPNIEGIDSFTLGLHPKTQSVYDEFDPSNVSISFS